MFLSRALRVLANIALAIAVTVTPGLADTLWNNGSTGLDTGQGNVLNFGFKPGDDFQLTSASVARSVSFDLFLVNNSSWDGVLSWSIYNDSAGFPGSLVASGSGLNMVRTPLGSLLVGPNTAYFEEVRFDLLASGVALGAGTYWLRMETSDATGDEAQVAWARSSSLSPILLSLPGRDFINGFTKNDAGAEWNLAFRIDGTVPEPATISLLGFGIAALAFIKRRMH